METLVDSALVLGGIAFDPHIRSILVVLTGFVILCGSVYLLLLTNVGSRLGFLVAAAGLFAWMFILGITWTLTPPAIGPRGHTPTWEVIDIAYGDPAGAASDVVQDLPNQCWSTVTRDCEPVEGTGTISAQLIAANPAFADEVGEDATVSEILSVEPGAVDDIDFGAWHMISSAEAGEAVSAADESMRAEGIFETSAGYIVLDAWEQGGKDPLPDNPSRIDRIVYKIETTAQFTHPTHYAAIQFVPVLPQEVEEGAAPPPPVPDPDAPVITVVLERNLGNLRMPAFLVTITFGILLGVTIYALHRRDKLAMENRAEG